MKTEVILHDLYYNQLNFDGVEQLYNKAKKINPGIKKEEVSKWLKDQSTYQQTKAAKKVGKTELLPIYSDDPDAYQIDLTFLPKYKEKNKGNYILFTGINVTTRMAYAYYSKDKEADTVIEMLDKFLKDVEKISTITTDSGSEFTNNKVTKWFDHHKITLFYVVGDSHKLGIINRFHRTLKGKLLKYFVSTGSVKWTNVIDKIIYNYNNTVNRGIGFTPTEAHNNGLIQSKIVNDAIDKTLRINVNDTNKYEVGDKCRILKSKELFNKLDTNFSKEIYQITEVKKNNVTVCLLNDPTKIYKNIKKKYVQIVGNYIVDPPSNEKQEVEKNYKVKTKLKKEGVAEANVVREQRVKKAPQKLNL